jgi:hypothetical protein
MATVFDYKTSRPVNLTTGIPLLIEAGDYIFINGRPYDKSTLAPVPEGVALVPLYSARANVAPVCTTTRYWSRYLGDGTAPPYRLPLPPSLTPIVPAADISGLKWIGVPDEYLTLVQVDGNFKANNVYTGSTTWGSYRLGMSRFIPVGGNMVTFGRNTVNFGSGEGYSTGFAYIASYYALYSPKFGFPVVLNSVLSPSTPSTPSWLSYGHSEITSSRAYDIFSTTRSRSRWRALFPHHGRPALPDRSRRRRQEAHPERLAQTAGGPAYIR